MNTITHSKQHQQVNLSFPSSSSSEFSQAIRSAGLSPPPHITPGKWHLMPGAGKRNGNTAARCYLFPDCRGGIWWDWSSGQKGTWQEHRSTPYSKAEREAFYQQVKEAQEQAKIERRAAQEQTAIRARHIFAQCPTAPLTHPYLQRKQIRSPYTARFYQSALVLPIHTFNGELVNLQRIYPDGKKLFLPNGEIRGCCIVVNGCADASMVIITEGWATGCALAREYPDALILAALCCWNLEAVAVNARYCWPNTKLIIASDDDRQTELNTGVNPGREAANKAAIAANALVCFPTWPDNAPKTLTDFSDLLLFIGVKK